MKLIFPFNQVYVLIRHTFRVEDHVEAYGGKTLDRGLIFVKDAGIYLMSNGVPYLQGTVTDRIVVYAEGYDPYFGDTYDKCKEAVGGDDFAELLVLTSEFYEATAHPDDRCFWVEFQGAKISYGISSSLIEH